MLGCQELAESSGYEQWQGAVARSSPRSGLHTGAAHRASRALLAPELTKEGVRVSATNIALNSESNVFSSHLPWFKCCKRVSSFITDATDAKERPLPHRELHEAGGAAWRLQVQKQNIIRDINSCYIDEAFHQKEGGRLLRRARPVRRGERAGGGHR